MSAGSADVAIVRVRYADVAQLVEHLVANEKVAGSSPVVRSRTGRSCTRRPQRPPGTWLPDRLQFQAPPRASGAGVITCGTSRCRGQAAWPSGLGRGLQSPVRRFDSDRRLQRVQELFPEMAGVVAGPARKRLRALCDGPTGFHRGARGPTWRIGP